MRQSNRNSITRLWTSTRARTIASVLAPLCAASALALAVPATAQAGNSCTSEWVKFKSFFDKNGPKVAKGICQLFNKDDVDAAKKCQEDYEKAKAKVDATIHNYNSKVGDSQWKVGPRGLGEDTWLTGTLLAERTFAGAPVMSDRYRLEFKRTGGKEKRAMTGTVCFVDADGKVDSSQSFSIDRSRTSYDRTFTGVAGLTPVILLKKPWGTNGHQYTIRGSSGAEPAIVAQARKTAASGQAGANNLPCANPCPHGGKYDGANCYVGSPPSGTKAFLYGNNYYYTPAPGNTCSMSGSWYDGANCYLRAAPRQASPFIWSNNWYYKACR